MTQITVQELFGKTSMHDAISYALSCMPKCPIRPKKPTLPIHHTSSDIAIYEQQFKLFELQHLKFDEELKEYTSQKKNIETVIENYIKEYAGLDRVPEQYREKLYQYAYQRSHSEGYASVCNTLEELVDIFL